MIRLPTIRFNILALAFLVLVPAGSNFASLILFSGYAVIESDAIKFELDSMSATPANVPTPEAPEDQEPGLWSLNFGQAGSMASGLNSIGAPVTDFLFETVRYVLPALQIQARCLFDFQFIPETEPDANGKPPKLQMFGICSSQRNCCVFA